MSFEYLGLSDEVLAAVKDAGYSEPTPIQRSAIPTVLQGRDVLGIAQTGTGKTAGFTLPMIDILAAGRAKARMPRSLILEPTRELAAQVAESFEKYGKNYKLTMALLIGGVSFGDQEKKLNRGVDVLIATPGRLLDHIGRGKVMLSGVQILVVDEADRMLDMGFIPDVERICKLMPQGPQSLFFSATMPPPVKRLTDQFLKDPKVIEVAPPATTAENVTQELVECGPRDKEKALVKLMKTEDITNGLIFCNRKVEVKSVYNSLKRSGFDIAQLHGDMHQSDRMDVLGRFKGGEVKFLIASDVAARGLDIPSVSHVFNYDIPIHAEDYVHRIGRTGRAGRAGKAFTIVSRKDQKYIDAIESLIGRKLDIVGAKSGPSKPSPAPADAGEKEAAPAEKSGEKSGDGEGREGSPDRSREGRSRGGRSRGRRGGRGRGQGGEKRDGGQNQEQKHAPIRQETSSDNKTEAETPKPSNEPASKPADKSKVGFGDNMPAFLGGGSKKSD